VTDTRLYSEQLCSGCNFLVAWTHHHLPHIVCFLFCCCSCCCQCYKPQMEYVVSHAEPFTSTVLLLGSLSRFLSVLVILRLPVLHCAVLQLLLSAKAQLESVVTQRLEEAVAARDHAAVLHFVRLHKPLAAPDKGVSRCGRHTCVCATTDM
jgi:hypothetical protein